MDCVAVFGMAKNMQRRLWEMILDPDKSPLPAGMFS